MESSSCIVAHCVGEVVQDMGIGFLVDLEEKDDLQLQAWHVQLGGLELYRVCPSNRVQKTCANGSCCLVGDWGFRPEIYTQRLKGPQLEGGRVLD